MDKKEIKIGTRVKYRSSFGAGNKQEVTINRITDTIEYKDVDSISWDEKNYYCFDLSNGKRCYGSQIDEVVDTDIEVRIVFRSEVYLKGKNFKEIKEKWQGLNIYSCEALDNFACFLDLNLAERVDDDSWEDVTEKFD